MRQRTIKYPVGARGVGLHSGCLVDIVLHPAPPDSGITFRRVDLDPVVEIPAHLDFVGDTRLATTLSRDEVRVGTIEHLLAALVGFGVDNVRVDVNADELPIMDGSACVFVLLLKSAGLDEQDIPKRFIRILREVSVSDEDKTASLSPYEGYALDVSIDFGRADIEGSGTVQLGFSTNAFIHEICRARTFGFQSDVEGLRDKGLIKGGNLDNAIVIDDEGVVNSEGLRSSDELIQHKILDAVGDLSLLGCGLLGRFSAHKSGHQLNNQLLNKLLSEKDAWEEVSFSDTDLVPIEYDYFPMAMD